MTTTQMNETKTDCMFEVAGIYANRDGEYMVMMLDNHEVGHRDATMTVEYVSGPKAGTTAVLDVKGQEKVFRNMNRERKELFPVERNVFFQTLGYIARFGRLSAFMPPHAENGFLARYREETGVKLVPGDYCLMNQDDKRTWGVGLDVNFPFPKDNMSLDFGCNSPIHEHNGSLKICSNDLWWRMIQMGFRIGSIQHIDGIRANIPSKYQADFDAGVFGVVPEAELMSKVA